MKSVFVTDIKLAAILIAFGIPRRSFDPTTCEVKRVAGIERKQYRFWFDVTDPNDASEAQSVIADYGAAKDWETLNRDAEHPLYWMKGVLENRDSLVHEMNHKVAEMSVIQVGDKTIVIGHRASHELREKMKSLL